MSEAEDLRARVAELEEEVADLKERLQKRRKPSAYNPDYLDDGSMVCPFGKYKISKPCDYHTYSGCTWDSAKGGPE